MSQFEKTLILPDLQNREDARGISIDRVGITGYIFPVEILNISGEVNSVSAVVDLFVGLPHNYKGVNMSRFSECLLEFSDKMVGFHMFPQLLSLMQTKLESADAYARFEFDYFIKKTSPVSKIEAPQAYRCAFTGIQHGTDYTFILEVNVVAASVCPCSREMSLLENLFDRDIEFNGEHLIDLERFKKGCSQVGMGAHNQRSKIKVRVITKPNEIFWIEDLIKLIEGCASAPTYPILKRPDEKFVTELGYNNAKFSEDILRDIQLGLEAKAFVDEWFIKVDNEESIHPFNATSIQHSKGWKF